MGKGPRLLPKAPGTHGSGKPPGPSADARQSVFLDKSLPIEVRYLAIIQLKNGIDKYWRKTATKYALRPCFQKTAADTATVP